MKNQTLGRTIKMNDDKKTIEIIDNSINIQGKSKIKNSNVGTNNKLETVKSDEKISSKIIWQIIIPIVVGVAVVAIALWLGLK